MKRKRAADVGTLRPMGLTLARLNAYNARYVGTIIQILFEDKVWRDGVVVGTSGTNLVVDFNTLDCGCIEVDPGDAYGFVTHCPIRIGPDYQVDIPEREA